MCGPSEHPEFFKALSRVFAEHTEAAKDYSIACLCLHKDTLKIDFTKQVGITKVDEGRLVTQFVERAAIAEDDDYHAPCCQWVPLPGGHGYACIEHCDE